MGDVNYTGNIECGCDDVKIDLEEQKPDKKTKQRVK